MAKRKQANADRLVQAKDCYDERDYILVHRKYFDGMRDALRAEHIKRVPDCICIYCIADNGRASHE